MNELIQSMSSDMKIPRCMSESDESYVYRICYSALGQWCLSILQNSDGEMFGTSKNNITIVLNELQQKYCKLFPYLCERLSNEKSSNDMNLAQFIRKVYEEMGYLLIDTNNRNRLVSSGRCIKFGDELFLYFGSAPHKYCVNGLGVFSKRSGILSTVNEIIIRDDLSLDSYIESKYDSLEFNERELSLTDMQFFNPLSKTAPSRSWESEMNTEYSISKKPIDAHRNAYYRVIKTECGKYLYANELIDEFKNRLTSREYRKLYFALRAHYENPIRAWLRKQDEVYSLLSFEGHLPNREYYLLLLISWPYSGAFDRVNFLIKSDFVSYIEGVLSNLGIKLMRI